MTDKSIIFLDLKTGLMDGVYHNDKEWKEQTIEQYSLLFSGSKWVAVEIDPQEYGYERYHSVIPDHLYCHNYRHNYKELLLNRINSLKKPKEGEHGNQD